MSWCSRKVVVDTFCCGTREGCWAIFIFIKNDEGVGTIPGTQCNVTFELRHSTGSAKKCLI